MSIGARLRSWSPRTLPLPQDVFDDLQMGRVGDANRARLRIAAALTRGLRPLRADELDAPAFRDPTRPTTAVAAFPGGVVPDDIP